MMKAERLPIRGCRDLVPKVMSMRRSLLNQFASLARIYGFVEVDTPIIERIGLYASALGSSSDIVSSELFRVSGPQSHTLSNDREHLVLRPEGTAGIARAFAPSASQDLARVWYVGPMFRYERPQRLRLRQFTQLGVECLGEDQLCSDVDCISLARKLVSCTNREFCCTLVVNTLGSREDRNLYNEKLLNWLAPRYSTLSELSKIRFDSKKCLRILDSKLPEDQDALRNGPMLSEFVASSEHTRFQHLQQSLADAGITYVVDPTLVRGLEYYTSTAFEFLDNEERAVCAGGRYENVNGARGVGFAAGLERLIQENDEYPDGSAHSTAHGLQNAVVVLAWTDTHDGCSAEVRTARAVVRDLRHAGVSCVSRTVTNKLGRAIGRAASEGACAVVVIGSDELSKGVVRVKMLRGTTHQDRAREDSLPQGHCVARLREYLQRDNHEMTK